MTASVGSNAVVKPEKALLTDGIVRPSHQRPTLRLIRAPGGAAPARRHAATPSLFRDVSLWMLGSTATYAIGGPLLTPSLTPHPINSSGYFLGVEMGAETQQRQWLRPRAA